MPTLKKSSCFNLTPKPDCIRYSQIVLPLCLSLWTQMGCPQIHLGWDQIRDHCRSGPQKLYWPQTVLMAPIRVCPKTGLRCVLHRYLFGWGQYDAIAYIGPPDYTSYYCRACCGQSSYYGRWAQSFQRIVETFILSSYWYLSLPATGNFRVTFYQSWT